MKERAIITGMYFEDVFMDIWLSYYEKFFKDIFVVKRDPEDTKFDEVSKRHKFNQVDFYRQDLQVEIEFIDDTMRKLLDEYSLVMFCHADEFIVPDPKYFNDLDDYLIQMDHDYEYASGYEVLQDEGEEAMDFSKPMLSQRKYMSWEYAYSKPVLFRKFYPLKLGGHVLQMHSDHENYVKRIMEKDLYLFHMVRCDWDLYNKRKFTLTRHAGDSSFFHSHFDKKIEIPEGCKVV